MKSIVTHAGPAVLSRPDEDVPVNVVVTWCWDVVFVEPDSSRNGGGHWRCDKMVVLRDDGTGRRVNDLSVDEYEALKEKFHAAAAGAEDFYEEFGVRVL